MKGIKFICFLCFFMLMAGCSSITSNSYVVTRPHSETTQNNGENNSTVSSYAELCRAIEDLVSDGQETGIIYCLNYDEMILNNDLPIAVSYVKEEFPLGAYALKDISYETGDANSGHAVAFTLSYHHTRSEIKKIQHATSLEYAKETVYNALSRCDSDLVIQVDGYTDTDFVQVIEDFALNNPDKVMETPNVSVTEYPESGSSRILEFNFNYSTSRDTLRNMKNTVSPIFSSATLYVSKDAEPDEKIAQLYAFLSQRYDYRFESSVTPAYSLLRHGVGDSRSFASVYATMCRNVDVTCYIVSGTKGGQPYYWNIIFDNDRYYHIDLPQCIEDDVFSKKDDIQMTAYVWNYSEYPSCGYSEPTPESME